MGSTARVERILPPCEKPAQSPRSALALVVVAGMIRVVQAEVFGDVRAGEPRERECYLVAEALRSNTISFRLRSVARDLVPGSVVHKDTADITKRMKLADKLVMVFTDHVVNVIVRPGPTPEDRQACDLSTELSDIAPELTALLAAVLVEEDRHDGLVT